MDLHLPEIWIIVGLACVLLEFVLPGAIIVFLGVSAIVTGLLLKAGLPTSSGIPFVVFMALSAAQLVFLRRYVKTWFTGSSEGSEDSSLEEFVGKSASVTGGFENGSGKGTVVFKGTNWNALSEDSLNAGDEVIIRKQDGITLHVSSK